MKDKINLAEKFDLFDEHWTPKILGESNGQYIKLAKGEGELAWHQHENEDELFLVVAGQLTLKMHEGDVVLNPGELYVVPKGVEHCPVAKPGTKILLIEPKSTEQLGQAGSADAVAINDQEWI